ncbi:hypothetical protein MTR67_040244 [Solanum verrucosum]|uniref:Uncharacterized protein n=1 Tax=Solanum verrucosum TaxID=315347 RepID=A0AAF0UKG1_SOLVR|nr:hypothetical protein MTR67_040244 [Solanum verrucosum]
MLERLCKKYTNVDSLAFLTGSNADIATLEDLGTPQIGNAKSVEANSVQEPVGKKRTSTKIYMVKVMKIKWENNDTNNFTWKPF